MSLSDKIVVMSRGVVEQYGTPSEVYGEPDTEFVATFVGKPRMNMFTVMRVDPGHYSLSNTPIRFEFRGGDLNEIRLGFRPEDCQLRQVAEGEQAHAMVQLVEPLGNATNVVLASGPHQIVVRTQGFSPLRRGDEVMLNTSESAMHGFDPATGKRLV